MLRKLMAVLLLAAMMFAGAAWADQAEEILVDGGYVLTEDLEIEYGEYYYTPEEVSLYLHVFCCLPENYITKDEARELGWDSWAGNLWKVAEGMCIGGDQFGNREGLLPKKKGRTWYECDVNYSGGRRDKERLLYSNDGLIYYTGDHYQSYELLYEGWYVDENGDVYGEVWADANAD